VIYRSKRRFIQLYNSEYSKNVNYKDIKTWDFQPQCDKLRGSEDIERIFCRKDFYISSEDQFFEGAIESIDSMSKHFNIIICTAGRIENNKNKTGFINSIFPNISVVTVTHPKVNHGKDFIIGDYIVDDHVGNLISNKSNVRILFKPYGEVDWNKEWTGKGIRNWSNLLEYIYIKEGIK
jgi:5'(3')-deoxyribonucleotidase